MSEEADKWFINSYFLPDFIVYKEICYQLLTGDRGTELILGGTEMLQEACREEYFRLVQEGFLIEEMKDSGDFSPF